MARKRRQGEPSATAVVHGLTARMMADFPSEGPIVRQGELVTCAAAGSVPAVYVDPVRLRWLLDTGRAMVEEETLVEEEAPA